MEGSWEMTGLVGGGVSETTERPEEKERSVGDIKYHP